MITLKTQQLQININKKQICNQLSLDFMGGEFWVVLGNNGSGKTTFLHTLAGLRSASQGNIFIGHADERIEISQASRKKIAKIMGLLPQINTETPTTTVFEAVLIGRYPHIKSWYGERKNDYAICMDALKHMQMETMQSRLVDNLSGGELRRVAIARLLAQRPNVYLLDEPINHLDLKYQMRVLNHFRFLASHHHCIVIASLHDINLAYQFCDKAFMLPNNGNVLFGNKEALFKTSLLEELYQHPLYEIEKDKHKMWFAQMPLRRSGARSSNF